MSNRVARPGEDEHSEWWKHAVIYQIAPRSFCDTDGDGVGDVRGILEHLDHLERLGVDAIWLCPIFPSSAPWPNSIS